MDIPWYLKTTIFDKQNIKYQRPKFIYFEANGHFQLLDFIIAELKSHMTC